MNTKKFIISSLVGGITYFFLGYLIYAILLQGFFAGHTVEGVMKTDEQMKMYPLIMGNMAHGALLSFIFLKWTSIKSFGEGMTWGAVIGFFMAAGFDLMLYDTARMMSIIGTLGDIAVYTVMSAIVGGVIALVIGKLKD
jgi:uncharacterized membrane protein